MSGIGHHTTNVQTLRRVIDTAERRALEPVGLNIAQFEAMDVISRHPGISTTELATRLRVSTQTTHTLTATLASRALIARGPARGRRPMPLSLTRTGRAALRAGRACTGQVDAAFADALGPAQLAELTRLLGIGLAAFTGQPEAGS